MKDNQLARLVSQVQNPEERILLRIRRHHQMEAPNAVNLRALDQQRESLRRERKNGMERLFREQFMLRRKERLEREERDAMA